MDDWGDFWISIIFATGVCAVIWFCWWAYQHPCVQWQAVWVREYTEMQHHTIDYGNGNSATILIPVTHPAHWEQRCVVRGNRANGDVTAPYAPVPAMRPGSFQR